MTKNLIDKRRRLLGPNMSLFYDDPVHLVRGQGVWVYDADGRKYLEVKIPGGAIYEFLPNALRSFFILNF